MLGRIIILLAFAAAAAVFLVENTRRVSLRFASFDFHPRIRWMLLGTFAVGIVFGYVFGRARRKSRRAKQGSS
jgi:uncharacterized integral membrane protein